MSNQNQTNNSRHQRRHLNPRPRFTRFGVLTGLSYCECCGSRNEFEGGEFDEARFAYACNCDATEEMLAELAEVA